MSKQLIANNLRKFRFLENEMTQVELAKIVGVTRQTIIALEAGRYTPIFFWADEENAIRLYRNRNE